MWQGAAIGAIAAVSIYAGMPVARSERFAPLRAGLTAVAAGILLFLLFDVLSASYDAILVQMATSKGSVFDLVFLEILGIAVGALVLPTTISVVSRRRGTRQEPAGAPVGFAKPAAPLAPLQLSLLTAVGLGLHNFSEGVAVGTAFAGGVAALGVLLAIGVILHKSAEGYCICGCAPGAATKYSWPQLGGLGLIGGGPTLLGALVGGAVGSVPLVSAFVFGLAAGAIVSILAFVFRTVLRGTPRRVAGSGVLLGFGIAFGANLLLSLLGL